MLSRAHTRLRAATERVQPAVCLWVWRWDQPWEALRGRCWVLASALSACSSRCRPRKGTGLPQPLRPQRRLYHQAHLHPSTYFSAPTSRVRPQEAQSPRAIHQGPPLGRSSRCESCGGCTHNSLECRGARHEERARRGSWLSAQCSLPSQMTRPCACPNAGR